MKLLPPKVSMISLSRSVYQYTAMGLVHMRTGGQFLNVETRYRIVAGDLDR